MTEYFNADLILVDEVVTETFTVTLGPQRQKTLWQRVTEPVRSLNYELDEMADKARCWIADRLERYADWLRGW